MGEQYKLHNILKSKTREVQGLTIPKEIAQFFSGCYFKLEVVKHNGKYGIFCTSGTYAQPTAEEVKNYDFKDSRV